MSKERAIGYYWIKTNDNIADWEVAHWNGTFWQCVGDGHSYSDDMPYEIDETPIKRKENE